MWKTYITKNPASGMLNVQFLHYVDVNATTHDFGREFQVAPEGGAAWLDDYVSRIIAQLDLLRTAPEGEYVATTPPPPPPPPTPTQEQLDTEEFRVKQARLARALRAVNAGLLNANSTVVSTLRNRCQTLLSTYPNLIDLVD